ncbi:MAG: hypothetical protein K940chlam7_00048 [Chlamydiae bacterium]|nr:hypothetical protein [Chlamydiota bacterium]
MNELVNSVHRKHNTPWNKSLAEGLKNVAGVTDSTRRGTNVVEVVLQVAISILKFIPGTELAAASLEVLKGKCGMAKGVFNGTNIFERGFEWSDKKARDGILSRWEKTANRVLMTVANFLDAVLFVDKLSIGFFAQAALCVCTMPILEIVKGGLVVLFSAFGLVGAGKDLVKARRSTDKAYKKGEKWLQRQKEFSEDLKVFKGKEVAARYKEKISKEEDRFGGGNQDKIDNWRKYVDALNKGATEDNLHARVTTFQKLKLARIIAKNKRNLETAIGGDYLINECEKDNSELNSRLNLLDLEKTDADRIRAKIQKKQKEIDGLKKKADDGVSLKIKPREKYIEALEKPFEERQIDRFIQYKTKKYAKRINNDNKTRTKSWISVSADIGKIVMVVLGITTTLLAATVCPVLAGPYALLILAALGLISASLGLAKPLYSVMGPKTVNEKEFAYPKITKA